MPFQIIRNDLAKMQVDAVVNAANPGLVAGGGVCGSLFHEAGFENLSRACRTIGGCEVGDAVVTPGFNLSARYIIHAVGPVWHGGQAGEAELLRRCYDRSLALAVELGLESIAFPLISTGGFGYPKTAALSVALESFSNFLVGHDLTIYLVVFDRGSVQISKTLFASVLEYIDDVYEEHYEYVRTTVLSDVDYESFRFEEPLGSCSATGALELDLLEVVGDLDESFSECLLRLIDERGMTDVEVYKRANISRKLFSKIRSNPNYRPSKPTVLAFAIALRLSLEGTKSLLEKAGFALSHASKFDVIVEYFILREAYDIFVINEALFAFDQVLLGS